ncbi:hypothetical protein [Pseudonocardia sp.]|uniref:hypothetical protein n=1 Tax=Pseudonocardia sp. TaxID=60912 RepID=UPI003D10B208
MIKLCEACYRQIAEDEPHAELRALFKVSASGRPEWRSLYLHSYDADSENCVMSVRSEQRAG